MADRSGKSSLMASKPVPMKLFATWEIEKSSPNCIPRLCSLTLTRIVVHKSIEPDLQSLLLAVKMQGSKRILRSNEFLVPQNGSLDTELDLSFSLQYPHFLKRDTNKLQVLLQRRKKYKNRTILGYKTLAHGFVNMSHVLQRSVDRLLELRTDVKDQESVVAQVYMSHLSSQPVEREGAGIENGRRKLHTDRSPDVDMSDDDYADDDVESEADDLSENEANGEFEDECSRVRTRKHGRTNRPFMSRQRNMKQKFIALLKRFKVNEEVDSEQDQELVPADPAHAQEIEDLFNELEDLSDSGPEIDTVSVLSTPKPKLRPFFTSSKSHESNASDTPKDVGRVSDDSSGKRFDSDGPLEPLTDEGCVSDNARQSSPRRSGQDDLLSSARVAQDVVHVSPVRDMRAARKERAERTSNNSQPENLEPRKALLEQLAVLLLADDVLPDSIVMVNAADFQAQLLAQALHESGRKVINTCSPADIKTVVGFIVSKIQKFCNSNSAAPAPLKLVLAGGDAFINAVLRPYVDQFSSKSPDWANYIRFLVVPTGACALATYLGSISPAYSFAFTDSSWKEAVEQSDSNRHDMAEMVRRVNAYISKASECIQLPIAEAMVTYKERRTEDESCQLFVPFIYDVRIGPVDVGVMSLDQDDWSSVTSACTSAVLARNEQTPPNSPNPAQPSIGTLGMTSPCGTSSPEYMELQLDYWTAATGGKSDLGDRERLSQSRKETTKSTLKSAFKSIQVFRCSSSPVMELPSQNNAFSMCVVTKEKKQKMRINLGKKKDPETKSHHVENITRLVCTSKSITTPLTVYIDGVEWTGVKFFQLTASWQTHIKNFPVLTMALNDDHDL